MKRSIVIVLIALFLISCGDDEEYVFQSNFTDEKSTLTIDDKYLYLRFGDSETEDPFFIRVRYPEMDSNNINDDNRLTIMFQSHALMPQERTIDESFVYPYCDYDRKYLSPYKFLQNENGFTVYKSKSPGSSFSEFIHMPTPKVLGLYCIKCLENKTCTIHAATESGVQFGVMGTYDGFIDQWSDIFEKSQGLLHQFEIDL